MQLLLEKGAKATMEPLLEKERLGLFPLNLVLVG